jgi:hypothetical protein
VPEASTRTAIKTNKTAVIQSWTIKEKNLLNERAAVNDAAVPFDTPVELTR